MYNINIKHVFVEEISYFIMSYSDLGVMDLNWVT